MEAKQNNDKEPVSGTSTSDASQTECETARPNQDTDKTDGQKQQCESGNIDENQNKGNDNDVTMKESTSDTRTSDDSQTSESESVRHNEEKENTDGQKQQSKSEITISGNKYFVLLTGNTLQSHMKVIELLKNQIPNLEEVKTVDECDFILVFCPVVSRAGTDIEAALKQLKEKSATEKGIKPAFVVVLHHTFDKECIVPDSRRFVSRQNSVTVDCLFHEDHGLLECHKNQQSLDTIIDLVKPQVSNIRSPSWAGFWTRFSWGSTDEMNTDKEKAEHCNQVTNETKTHGNEGNMERVLSGNKYFVLPTGKTFKSDEGFIAQLSYKVPGLQKVEKPDECDFIMVFCPVVSRAGTDIEQAVKKLNETSGTKPSVLVVLHHTPDPECVVPNSSRTVKRENMITVDCLFHEDQGLLTCKRNDDAINHIKMQTNPMKHKTSEDQKELFKRGNSNGPGSSSQLCSTSENQDKQIPDNELASEQITELETCKKAEEKLTSFMDTEIFTQLETCKKQVKEKLQSFMDTDFSELIIATELKLVLLGRNGPDKTATQDIIMGRKERNEASASTATQQCESRQSVVAGRKVTVVDTPDWFTPDLSLEKLSEDMGLHLSSPGPTVFLLVIPAGHSEDTEANREEEIDQTLLKIQERFWGDVMIIFTVKDECQKINIEDFSKSGHWPYQRLVDKCGNRFHCINIMQWDDGSQVSELMEKIEAMEGNKDPSGIYQMIRDMERGRQEKNAQLTQEQQKMQETLKILKKKIQEYEQDLPKITDNVKKQLIYAQKREFELKIDIGENINKMYDRVAVKEEKYIKAFLPESQQTIWVSFPVEQTNSLKLKNELQKLFSKYMENDYSNKKKRTHFS